MPSPSSFHGYIVDRHHELDLNVEVVYNELFTSRKQYTRQINRPELMTHQRLMRLAYRLQVHPLFLVNEFSAASLMITDEDEAQLRAHYRLDPATNALRDEITSHSLSPSGGTEVAGTNF